MPDTERNLGPISEWSDANKLRMLARWFDTVYHKDGGMVFGDHEVQSDLRRMADRLEELDKTE